MKKVMKKGYLGLSALILSGILVGCGSEEGDAGETASDDGLKIEIIAKGFQHDFWQAVNAGAEDAAEEYGVDITFVGPSSETAISEQIEMLNSAINRNPDAIVLAALDTEASLDAINRASTNGIPIIGFDSGIPDAPEGTILANAATDNYAAGELAGVHTFEGIQDKLANSAKEPVRIGVIAQEVNSLSIYARTAGFVEKVLALLEQDTHVGSGNVAIVGHDRFSNGVKEADANVIIEVRVPADVTDSAGKSEALALLNREDLIAIYGSNEFAANVIINADDGLSKGRIGHDVIAIGVDSGTLQQDAIRNGKFYGSVTQNPVAIGYYSVKLAIQAIKGELVEDVDTGVEWYTQENIDTDAIQALLYE